MSPPVLPTALALESATTTPSVAVGTFGQLARHENSFAMFLLVFMLLAAAMVALFLMLRGCCFCDCFGGFGRSARRYEQPLDPQTIHTCMEAVRAHEEQEKTKWAGHGQWNVAPPPPALVVDSRRPLLPQQQQPQSHAAIPSISESVPPNAPPPPRACSPPPSYRSLNSSMDHLPAVTSTKI